MTRLGYTRIAADRQPVPLGIGGLVVPLPDGVDYVNATRVRNLGVTITHQFIHDALSDSIPALYIVGYGTNREDEPADQAAFVSMVDSVINDAQTSGYAITFRSERCIILQDLLVSLGSTERSTAHAYFLVRDTIMTAMVIGAPVRFGIAYQTKLAKRWIAAIAEANGEDVSYYTRTPQADQDF